MELRALAKKIKQNQTGYKAIKYFLGGGISYTIRIGITILLTEIFGLHYVVSYVIANTIAVSFGFYFNTYITFHATKRKFVNFTKYLLSLIIFYFIDISLVAILTTSLSIHYPISITITALLLFTVKFLIYNKLVFKK